MMLNSFQAEVYGRLSGLLTSSQARVIVRCRDKYQSYVSTPYNALVLDASGPLFVLGGQAPHGPKKRL